MDGEMPRRNTRTWYRRYVRATDERRFNALTEAEVDAEKQRYFGDLLSG
jgi:hypothetical protein